MSDLSRRGFLRGLSSLVFGGIASGSSAFGQEKDTGDSIATLLETLAQPEPPGREVEQRRLYEEGELRIDGQINNKMLARVSSLLSELDETLPPHKPITVIINSEGGDPTIASAIADKLKYMDRETTTIAEGVVMSAALHIFMAGDDRLAYSSAVFMEHPVEMIDEKGMPSSSISKTDKEFVRFVTRSGNEAIAKPTTLTASQLDMAFSKDCFFDPGFALQHGIVTGIFGEGGHIIRSVDELESEIQSPISCPGWGASRMMPSPKPVFGVR